MENYKLIKLRSGESIIGDVKSITDYKTVLIDRPMCYRVVSLMDQKNAINSDLLLFRNYNEFSADNLVELPVDYIATIMNPDKNIIDYYVTEKKKQDLPSPSTLKEIFEDVDALEFDGPFDLPTEIIDQMMNGIQENLQSIEGIQPPKKKKKSKKAPPSPSKNKVDPTWGNKYTDWPIDPNDYI